MCGSWEVPQTAVFLESNRFAAWDLIGAIEENRQPVATIDDARTALVMVYGIYASHFAGKRIHFPLVGREHPLEEL